jgi:hypothetical protein
MRIRYELAWDLFHPSGKKLCKLASSPATAQAMALVHRLYLGALFPQQPEIQRLTKFERLFTKGCRENDILRAVWQASESFEVWILNTTHNDRIRVTAQFWTEKEFIHYKFAFTPDGSVVKVQGPMGRKTNCDKVVYRPWRPRVV